MLSLKYEMDKQRDLPLHNDAIDKLGGRMLERLDEGGVLEFPRQKFVTKIFPLTEQFDYDESDTTVIMSTSITWEERSTV